ncbi:MAG: NADH-quinone oxidoreductase subunit L [Dehalococcoidia bacterium]|nr:NADH-quinone oxidoreductase subunit L [Dehalococcoidia bacterium]
MNSSIAWLIFALPFIAFLFLAFPLRRAPLFGSLLSIAAVGAAFAMSLLLIFRFINGVKAPITAELPFLAVGGFTFPLAIHIDPLAALMLVVVTGVSLLVQIYSLGYMAGDPGITRYYAYLSLFTASMLGLVLAQNLALLYAFWELVGLSSFLLIGFWFTRPSAADAAKKAFLTTRLGDFGFLFALMILFAYTGTLDIPTLIDATANGLIPTDALTVAMLGLFMGAAGKSAQVPLHVWLPDAMEGPTPVSALIHAATMVAAGVYLVTRAFPMFEYAPVALAVVAWVGGVTCFIAATIALVQTDIKKVMAYSTISQLGYMMMALGLGGVVGAVFHLFTHAFFKALLFLGAGSVIHGVGTQDMREMGGLRTSMPVTFWTVVIGSLSLAGIFPLAGFWSKDEILADAFKHSLPLFVIGAMTAFLTALYVTRMVSLTFLGTHRGPMPANDHASPHDHHDDVVAADDHGHGSAGHRHDPHESPWVMLAPLLVLAVPSAIAGLWALNGNFFAFLVGTPGVTEKPAFNLAIAVGSSVLALAGIVVAWLMYGSGSMERAASVRRLFGPLPTIIERGYYFDTVYNRLIDIAALGLSRALGVFDTRGIDGVVNGVAWFVAQLGSIFRRWQTGRLQYYGLFLFIGAIAVFAVGFVGAGAFGPR